MANYISEKDIEKACVEVLTNEIGYDQHLNLLGLSKFAASVKEPL